MTRRLLVRPRFATGTRRLAGDRDRRGGRFLGIPRKAEEVRQRTSQTGLREGGNAPHAELGGLDVAFAQSSFGSLSDREGSFAGPFRSAPTSFRYTHETACDVARGVHGFRWTDDCARPARPAACIRCNW